MVSIKTEILIHNEKAIINNIGLKLGKLKWFTTKIIGNETIAKIQTITILLPNIFHQKR